jgi:hypothetical protein
LPERNADSSIPSPALPALAWLGLGLLLASIFIHPLCRLLFDCGCTWWWAGAAAHCNIHHAAPPHCPWCTSGQRGFAAVLLTILLLQALALRIVLRRGGGGVRKSALHPLAALVLGLLGGALVSGLAAALLGRYPTFLGVPLPAVF